VPAVTKNQQAITSNAQNLTGLNATTGFTVSWWHRWYYIGLTTYQAQGTIFSHYVASTSRNGYAVGFQTDGQVSVVIYGSAGFTITNTTGNALARSGRWAHCAVTFNDASNEVLVYVNGELLTRGTNTRDLTSATTGLTTGIGGSITQLGEYRGELFDIQVFPDVVIGPGDIHHLMNPLESVPGCKGRYFGVQSQQYTVGSNNVRDESENGNNLNVSGSSLPTAAEPPFRFTIA
jgi:hypothetical protein